MNDPLHDPLHDEQQNIPSPEPSFAGDAAPRVGFCQDCGMPLTAQTVRTVGSGVFCEPCLAARVAAAGAAAGAATGYANAPPVGASPVPPPMPGTANPVLAAFLGLIPGVGAMYNGQFAKGVAHLVIFVLLKLLEDIASVFGVFVVAWVFYQAFDAYHTAKARQEGLPLPNPFGLNEIGERMGFGRGWPNAGAGNWGATTPPPPSSWQAPPQPSPATDAGPVPVNPVPVNTGPDWIGYVPPTQFAGNQAAYHQPYTAPYAGAPYTPVPPAAVPDWTTETPDVPLAAARNNRLPVGALWLIALGALILMANMLPHWRVSDRWFPPLLLAGLAVWVFLRRLRRGARFVCVLRAPLVLMLLAIYFGLHAAFFMVSFGIFAAVVLIALGVLLLLERTIGANPAYTPPYAPPAATQRASFVPAADPVAPQPPVTPHADTAEGDAP